ncbi:MAG: sigma-54 dependent transcriptional regulator [Planctomycetota bacterium]|nr:sigma-54 dependent transcriptional regulator [Planctomycetota bacterium]
MDTPDPVAMDEFKYVPSSWPEPNPPTDLGELVKDSIARIESLKVAVANIAALGQKEREALYHELDLLRSAYIDVSSSHYRASSVAAPYETGGRMPGPLAEKSFSWKDDLIIEGIVGTSPAINQVLKTIAAVAPSSLAILLEGETGTGKELFARIIHLNSRRSKLVAVNCGAFPPGVIESELFGHVKGAFTGATSDRKGKFEEASEGTIFLDEIGELEPLAQVKLLRVLEVGELQRVGSDQTRVVNVRVIAATNRNLEEMVRQGKFREDLFYRINMCPVVLPPLRERRDEIPILLEYFLEEACAKQNRPVPAIDPELRHFLHHIYDFRGNIRELKNIAQFMACIGGARPILRSDLPLRVAGDIQAETADKAAAVAAGAGAGSDDVGGVVAATKGRTAILRKAEETYWVELLKKHHGNIRRICEETNLSPSRVYQILEKCKLRPKTYRE